MDQTILSTEGKKLTLERVFAAPADKVWAAWTTPDLFAKWWGPRGWSTVVKHMDLQPGGYLHYGMKCEDPAQTDWYGKFSWGRSDYLTVTAPAGFTYIDYFCDENAVIDPAMPATNVSVSFESVSGGTKLVSVSEFKNEAALKQLLEMGVEEGIKQTWDRLSEYLISSR